MVSNYLQEISALNKIDLNGIKGHRLYYSVYKSVISLIFSIVLIAFSVLIIIIIIMCIDNAAALLGCFSLFFSIVEIQYPIGRLMLKIQYLF